MSSQILSPVSSRRDLRGGLSRADRSASVPFVPRRPTRRGRPRSPGEAPGGTQRRRRRQKSLRGPTGRGPGAERGGPPQSRPPRVRRRLKPGGLSRWVRRFRIPVALLLGICAAAAALLAAESRQAQLVPAVRVTQPVAVGEQLTAAVLEEVQVDTEAVPDEHTGSMEDFLGRTAAAALPAGAVVHTSHLVGPGLLEGYDPGTVAVPVRPADASMIGLLSPGQRVDVTAASEAPEADASPVRIASAAPVLWIPQDESENWIGGASAARDVVILAVDSSTAEQIAQAGHQGRLHLSLVGEDSR
ncbi:Flp pilus assembly protein CpaB [Nesterenkonia sp.]|uniref:Flp pilus assembly protein CpaB n=1 Tax=Nesterenkonia sp. TaxID=704201 RepID=UPI00262056F2|nr:Flp pilus assembly protein CpaB [Nesterenkonia sp.]